MLVFQRAFVGVLDFFNYLRNPVRPEKRRAFTLFDFSDLFGNQCALVQQGQQLIVQGVDLDAQISECGGHVRRAFFRILAGS
jgi:hypothetical protein